MMLGDVPARMTDGGKKVELHALLLEQTQFRVQFLLKPVQLTKITLSTKEHCQKVSAGVQMNEKLFILFCQVFAENRVSWSSKAQCSSMLAARLEVQLLFSSTSNNVVTILQAFVNCSKP